MGSAPVTYIDLFENHVATLGIFVLNNVFTLPLHDHPSMFGFVKVLFGKVRGREMFSPLFVRARIICPGTINQFSFQFVPTLR